MSCIFTHINWAHEAMTPSSLKPYHEGELKRLNFSHQNKSQHTRYTIKSGSAFRSQAFLVHHVKPSIAQITSRNEKTD